MNKSLSTVFTSDEKQSGNLLTLSVGLGVVIFYIVFTLLPNSNSMMVKWPWVFIWQVGLMLGPVGLLLQLWQQSFRRLGGWLDWLAIAWCVALLSSAVFAPFPHQAFWYSWAAICGVAYLYVLNSWLSSDNRVSSKIQNRAQTILVFQALLSVVFSISSLVAWYFQTIRPALAQIESLKDYGIESSLNLQTLTLRNWHPLGHQNYVAGYLILVLPLLIGLAFSQRGWLRAAWLCGFTIGLVTLYTTASRAGWVSLALSLAVFISLSAWQYPKSRRSLFITGAVSFGGMLAWGISSDRIRTLALSLFHASPNTAPSYRAVTNVTGWLIGKDHPLFGAGLGSITLLYQKYRPVWAAQEAELTYQLHSTPAQLWAELGFVGTVLALVSLLMISWLNIRSCKYITMHNSGHLTISLPVTTGLFSGLAGYSLYATTDYQLDNICISGVLIIFVSTVIFQNREIDRHTDSTLNTAQRSVVASRLLKSATLGGTAALVAICIWLYPIHRAWMLSSQGFFALQKDNVPSFVAHLEKAHQLVPWEPYYAYQLGWNLGELAFSSTDPLLQEALRQQSVHWFEKAIQASPNREFGYSSLGWLLVNSDTHLATENFLKAAELAPSKNGTSFALGYSLLRQGEPERASQAMVSELFHQPIFLTNPIWKDQTLEKFYLQVLDSFNDALQIRLLEATFDKERDYYYQILGGLSWWRGDFANANKMFDEVPTDLNQAILALAQAPLREKNIEHNLDSQSAISSLVSAWQDGEDARESVLQALIRSISAEAVLKDYSGITLVANELHSALANSSDFHSLITQRAPSYQSRKQRLGFGTISRHIDGTLPLDFSPALRSYFDGMFLEKLFPRKN
ncbi:MAG: O-antigen ligase family protein [Cyanobacteria bacterium J06649_4]